jgi:hypothetical protein
MKLCCDLLEKKQFDGRLATIGCAAHEPALDAGYKITSNGHPVNAFFYVCIRSRLLLRLPPTAETSGVLHRESSHFRLALARNKYCSFLSYRWSSRRNCTTCRILRLRISGYMCQIPAQKNASDSSIRQDYEDICDRSVSRSQSGGGKHIHFYSLRS